MVLKRSPPLHKRLSVKMKGHQGTEILIEGQSIVEATYCIWGLKTVLQGGIELW